MSTLARCLLFIDDMNMPAKDNGVAQGFRVSGFLSGSPTETSMENYVEPRKVSQLMFCLISLAGCTSFSGVEKLEKELGFGLLTKILAFFGCKRSKQNLEFCKKGWNLWKLEQLEIFWVLMILEWLSIFLRRKSMTRSPQSNCFVSGWPCPQLPAITIMEI